jgi:hypothetical protein
VWQSPLTLRDPLGLDGGLAPSDVADVMDIGLRRIQNALLALDPDATDRNTIINFVANNLYGMHDLLRVGRGLGSYWYDCGSDLEIFHDLGRASNIALILAGGAKGAMGLRGLGGVPAELPPEAPPIPSDLPGLPGSAPKPLGLGSTGRTTPASLGEQMAMEEARSNPSAGSQIPLRQGMTDPRWPSSSGWIKMRQNINGHEIHYLMNRVTGAVDDFKIK